MRKHVRGWALTAAALAVAVSGGWAAGQESAATATAGNPEPVTFTTQEDHQNMMKQLGITRLRPGPSGQETAPNAANYDATKADPYPKLPDVLTMEDGRKVTSAEMWWKERRPEIVELMEREVYGRIPANVPGVNWVVAETRETTVGDHEVIEKRLEGRVDNSAYPAIEVTIAMTVVTPKKATGPVPVLIMYGGFGGPGRGRGGPGGPGGPGQQQGAAAGAGQGQGAGQQGAGQGQGGPGGRGPGGPGGPGGAGFNSRQIDLLAGGWGYAMLNPWSIQADNGAGLTRGIIGLTNKGQPRKPDDWGSLRAWGWGASRALDYLETDPAVDAKRVGIEGVSRYGKGALVAMAFEPRLAVVLIGSSGKGGATLLRRNWGEAVENLTGSGEYHWMAGNFLKYGAAEASFGSMTPGDLPVDSHQLIALCAPRLTFVSYGIPERGDAKWLDQQGSYMATIAAGPVYRLLGVKDLGAKSDDYTAEKMPDVLVEMMEGELAWRQHDGGHTDAPNMAHFVRWANGMFEKKAGGTAGAEAR